jgi:peroxiredoxin
MMMDTPAPLPDWSADQWFNTDKPLSLKELRGKVVVIEAFQMLCPGCVSHGLPLAQTIHDTFPAADVAVIGLHTVFEHHAAMTPVSLEAFIHEYRITFPVGVDVPGETAIPKTMERYSLRGTPSLLLIDRAGVLVAHYFGQINPLKLGADIGTLISAKIRSVPAQSETKDSDCDDEGCVA